MARKYPCIANTTNGKTWCGRNILKMRNPNYRYSYRSGEKFCLICLRSLSIDIQLNLEVSLEKKQIRADRV